VSGIAGIFCLDGRPTNRVDVEAMVRRMVRRGPDGTGVWSQGPIGLGHSMLWSTPESVHETLPLANASGDVMITADARIDNRAELIDALGIRGRLSSDLGDNELILLAYGRWGEACPEKLVGDFAFAIWDGRRQHLFCARDHFGSKSFYYHQSAQLFAFASEIKALLCLPQVPQQINEGRIADYLVTALEMIDRTSTFYQHISRFPPAHTMTIGRDISAVRSYWSLDPTTELHCSSDAEYAEAFLEVFNQAVGSRLRSASAPGSMLSGGLDSSSVVGVACQLLTKNGDGRLHTFSTVDDDATRCEETRSVNTMLRYLRNLEPFRISPDQFRPFLTDLEYAIGQMDDLFDTILMDSRLIMYCAARQRGLKSLLDGVDGDVVTSHREEYLRFLLRAGAWRTAAIEAAGYQKFFHMYDIGSTWQLLYRHGRAAFLPVAVRNLKRRLTGLRRRLRHLTKRSMINTDFARRVDLIGRFGTYEMNRWPKVPATLRELHAGTIVAPFVTVALERYDRVASMFSIEPRHPFFDKRLAEFCVGLPWQQMVRQGWQKHILRQAMTSILPEETRMSPKLHRPWARSDLTELWLAQEQTLLEDILFDRSQHLDAYVNVPVVRATYRRYVSGKSSRGDRLDLWQVATMALWLRRHCHA
jgi:asparagine synthase (glutamine-hydrolysing)